METIMSDTTTVTMYKAAKIVNEWLERDGVAKKLPPQMMYGYANKGYIESFLDEKGKVCTDEEKLAAWYAKYTAPKATKVVLKKDTVNTEELDLEGTDGTVGEW